MKQEKHNYDYHFFKLLGNQDITFVYILLLLFNYLYSGK